MKKLSRYLICIFCLSFVLALCSCTNEKGGDKGKENKTTVVDVNLSEMSDTMAYATMENINANSESYIGQVIMVTGKYDYQNDCHWIVLTDETLCCSIGMEFQLPDGEEYPAISSTITICGTYGQYTQSRVQHYFIIVEEIYVV